MRFRVLALVLLAALVAAAALHGGTDGGISGLVLVGPACPVERVPTVPGCAPRPLIATVRIRRSGERARAESVRSGSDGRFRVSLAPGTYTVEGTKQGARPLPRPPRALRVRVSRGRFTPVTLTYETGIR